MRLPRAPSPLDALYFLDYKGGRLLATVPTYQQTDSSTHLIEPFSERDLVSDSSSTWIQGLGLDSS